MELNEFYSYDNPLYAPLKAPATVVSYAFLKANRVGDTVKEAVRKRFKLPFTAAYFHIKLAHKALAYLDDFASILHTANLEQDYPDTNALRDPIEDMDKAFGLIVEAFDEVKKALYAFIKVSDNAEHKAMCIATEDLLVRVSNDYTVLLETWNAWGERVSNTSYDSWVKDYTNITEDIE